MTIAASGPLSWSDINVELGRTASDPLSSDDPDVVELAGRSDFNFPQDFYGKGYERGWVDTTRTITIGSSPVGYRDDPLVGSINNGEVSFTNGQTSQIRYVGSRWDSLRAKFDVLTLTDVPLPEKLGITFTVGGSAFYLVADRRLSTFNMQFMAEDNTHGNNLSIWLGERVGQTATVRLRDPA